MPRTYGKAKQTRLSFAPIALPTDDDENDEMAREATLKYGHPSRPTVPATRSKVNMGSARKASPDPFVVDKSTENGEVPTDESRKPRRKKDKKAKEAEKEKVKDEVKVKEKSEKGDKKKDKKKKRREKKEKKSRNPSPPPSETPEVISPAKESSDSDLEIQSSVRKNRAVKRKRSPSPESSSPQSPTRAGPSAQEDNDEEGVVARPRRKLRRGPAQPATIVLDDSSDESDEPIVSSPVKRRRRNMSVEEPQTPRRNRNQDQLDLEEDLEDLQDSVVTQSRTRGRVANSARAQRQKHLEALRRRRAGQTETDEEQSEPKPDETESSEDDSSEAEDEEEEAVRQPQIPFAREDSDVESEIASNEDLDRYDKDFVLDDDDDDKLGVPAGLDEMPIEFSRHSYKQLKDYFQDAVEWMVLNQLFPAFPRSSAIYKVAFDKLEDEVKGRTGSQLISSVWNADFCRALMARPHLEETTFPTTENHPCDACKRSGHPASADLKFYGKVYSLDTLEPLADSDSDKEQSDDEEEEDDGLERDRDGHVLPDENTRFYLGRHCKGRATMAHTLTHWRFHLNEWVVDHLARVGHVSDEKVLERGHWSQKRKAKYASEAFRDMVEGGEVKKLWRDFHINLRTARESTTLG
ncbi:uncharacterized protein KD926_010297 [Aspergillus affinis]|uniref:uncharacterized protein n=1 Tax=Aspergillus affinis TaxID=1070780 RepID=UPI0022FEB5AB|nr:uncharacterized protein KD926_010297 [Aspergillus affinis]KAI9044974.1 hypothetical protein KD926_010297 [Aspergillus affinis]